MELASELPAGVAFGRFRLLPHRRELFSEDRPIKLGSRAFDLLLALIETPGAVITKDALMTRVWPDRVVEENNLQAQIAILRRALGTERTLIRTVAGRGYRFTGEVRALPASPSPVFRPAVAQSASAPRSTNIPEAASEMIGREEELSEILNLVSAHRLVTLTGAGGIGKTTLALALARELRPHFADGVWLAEFSGLADSALVPAAVAAAVGLELSGGEISAHRVAQALANRQLLLVLDTCEHVIDAAAAFAEAILRTGPRLHIVATSREPLRAEGEWVYAVRPLAVPADDAADDQPLQYGAVRLFIERARAGGSYVAPDQSHMATIAAICRRLDGIPLAIELAAARVAALGIEEIAARLDDRLGLLSGGRRRALPRHQTLRATLDWSYELLTEPERVILRRLAVFAGAFSLDAVTAVAASTENAPSEIADGLSSLVVKSLVTAIVSTITRRYRVLDTTRAYAAEKLTESGEREMLARRHAEYYRDLFERAEAGWETRPAAEWLAEYGWEIDNLRGALDWTFSPTGEASIGVVLTAAAVPLWTSLSLMDECRSRVEQALAALTAGARCDTRCEMKLYAALATSLIYAGGYGPEQEAAWAKTLALAEQLSDTEYKLRAAWDLWALSRVSRWNRVALTEAQRFVSLAGGQTAPNHRLVGERMLGISYHYLGDQARARHHLENVLNEYVESGARSHIIRFQVDLRVSARTFLAPVLWLLGFPDQAMRTAETAIEDARAANHAMSLCHAFAYGACPTALLAGAAALGERYAHLLMDHAVKQGFGRWHAYSQACLGVILIKRGDIAAGLQLLRESSKELGGFASLRFMDFLIPEALCQAGEIAEGLAMVDEAIARSEDTEEHRLTPELLRVKGGLVLRENKIGAAATAEAHFRQALDLAREQGALSWELRAATSLARLLRDQGRSAEALTLLQPIYNRFTEGFATADLKTAKALLDSLP
jgi:predicted ATPase/DNA-binding winged helix-turn-helix (wHTH) protein